MFSSTDIDLVVDLVKALEHKQPEDEVTDVLEVGSLWYGFLIDISRFIC